MRISSFNLKTGEVVSKKYIITQKIGSGWEGEVYLVQERGTGIERSIKIFFPQRNKNNKTLRFHAKKLHKLRNCSIFIQYHNQESMVWKGEKVQYLVSEYVEGELLSDFLKRQPDKRMLAFQALHLLYALVKGIEEIHELGEYHGDLHTENIIIQRHGLGFGLKLVDLYQWKDCTKKENMRDDIFDVIKVFYEVLGEKKYYKKQPQVVKSIVLGLKKTLIFKRFRTATKLRKFIEGLVWG